MRNEFEVPDFEPDFEPEDVGSFFDAEIFQNPNIRLAAGIELLREVFKKGDPRALDLTVTKKDLSLAYACSDPKFPLSLN